jgi:hypothetical protein
MRTVYAVSPVAPSNALPMRAYSEVLDIKRHNNFRTQGIPKESPASIASQCVTSYVSRLLYLNSSRIITTKQTIDSGFTCLDSVIVPRNTGFVLIN